MAQLSTGQLSVKRIGVNKTNARIVIITSVAAFLVVFFLVGSWSLFGALTYQNRVIKTKKEAVSVLKKNLVARDSLVKSYRTFADAPVNYIGGSATGGGPQDGSNAKIVLDALPGTYDFPALTASLEKLAADHKVVIRSLIGTDDAVAQESQGVSDKPAPIAMPFQIKVSGDYPSAQLLIDAYEHSIRPIQVQTMKVTGDSKEISLEITAQTFYQPQKTLNIRTKVIQ